MRGGSTLATARRRRARELARTFRLAIRAAKNRIAIRARIFENLRLRRAITRFNHLRPTNGNFLAAETFTRIRIKHLFAGRIHAPPLTVLNARLFRAIERHHAIRQRRGFRGEEKIDQVARSALRKQLRNFADEFVRLSPVLRLTCEHFGHDRLRFDGLVRRTHKRRSRRVVDLHHRLHLNNTTFHRGFAKLPFKHRARRDILIVVDRNNEHVTRTLHRERFRTLRIVRIDIARFAEILFLHHILEVFARDHFKLARLFDRVEELPVGAFKNLPQRRPLPLSFGFRAHTVGRLDRANRDARLARGGDFFRRLLRRRGVRRGRDGEARGQKERGTSNRRYGLTNQRSNLCTKCNA